MNRPIFTAALLIFCTATPIALWEGYRFLPRSGGVVPTLSYAEIVTVVLGALTVALAFLALAVGVLAIWGYQSIKSEAHDLAQRTAKEGLDKAIAELVAKQLSGEIGKTVRREMLRSGRREAYEAARSYSSAFSPEVDAPRASGNDADHIGDEYPGGD